MRLLIRVEGIKALSLNNVFATLRNGRRIKTAKYKEFESLVNNQLRKYRNQINKFNNYYKKEDHCLVAKYRFYHPIKTKKNLISEKSGDVTNLFKTIEDIIFKQLIPDDSQVVAVYGSKIESDKPRIEVEITIKPLKFID